MPRAVSTWAAAMPDDPAPTMHTRLCMCPPVPSDRRSGAPELTDGWSVKGPTLPEPVLPVYVAYRLTRLLRPVPPSVSYPRPRAVPLTALADAGPGLDVAVRGALVEPSGPAARGVRRGVRELRAGQRLTYHELLVARLVRAGRSAHVRITDIWVDSPASRDGGRSLWAIPKHLADLPLDSGAGRAGGAHVVQRRRRRSAPRDRAVHDAAEGGGGAGAVRDVAPRSCAIPAPASPPARSRAPATRSS